MSDADRGDMLALIYHEDTTCGCGCGLPVDIAHSRDYNFDVNTVKCYAGQALDIVRRSDQEKNKGVKGWDDGVMWTVRPILREQPESQH